ncbi:unnamed protein product [Nesidiocoris tenuis]|uniref:NADH dehydrogenase [ubiquinone] 1 alpha subcomplex assembly factor 3 n=1 Tax=Nesidiocoris tenuis TaxID=355587 RepID=A0A6H5G6P6_9HEMI|nr:unnamed protein product [Nesidiocoris tenuis]
MPEEFSKIKLISSVFQTAYDAEGKTSVTVLNQQPGLGLMIDSYSKLGFRLNNGSFLYGPVVLFPKTILSWNVEDDDDITEESLDLFAILSPKPDVLIVGFGGTSVFKRNLDKVLHNFRISKKINLEILPTSRAIPTFNFLNAEGRFVVAALIPPRIMNVNDSDLAMDRERHKKLYEFDDD